MTDFKKSVYELSAYLSELENPTLEQLVELSRQSRRVRNVTPFFGLYFAPDKWANLVRTNRDVNTMNHYLLLAVQRLLNNEETAEVVRHFISDCNVKGKSQGMVSFEKRDPSFEMAKLFTSLVRKQRLSVNISNEDQQYVQEQLSKVDFTNLFLKNKK